MTVGHLHGGWNVTAVDTCKPENKLSFTVKP
jgi:hypothetical protein